MDTENLKVMIQMRQDFEMGNIDDVLALIESEKLETIKRIDELTDSLKLAEQELNHE